MPSASLQVPQSWAVQLTRQEWDAIQRNMEEYHKAQVQHAAPGTQQSQGQFGQRMDWEKPWGKWPGMLADKKLNITQECELASQKTNHVLVGPSVQRRVSSMLWEVAISINQNTARKQVIKAAFKVLIFP